MTVEITATTTWWFAGTQEAAQAWADEHTLFDMMDQHGVEVDGPNVATHSTNPKTAADLARALAIRMREIDSDITMSAYFAGRGNDDRPPTGDDFNLLWDAILDEVNALAPEISMSKLIEGD